MFSTQKESIALLGVLVRAETNSHIDRRIDDFVLTREKEREREIFIIIDRRLISEDRKKPEGTERDHSLGIGLIDIRREEDEG